uniref:Leucine-rich repeat domain-containing protein n=1 Tax=Chaetoceros debilis TaxID=122233 RepID=A0A7S3VGD5_9STRA
MRVHIYRGLEKDEERIPKDVTHVIIDKSVTVIRKRAFSGRKRIISVIMADNVKRIEKEGFRSCYALRFIQLSKTLEYIGKYAFYKCYDLEALFLPSTVESIETHAFNSCQSLRLLILPNDVDIGNNLIHIHRLVGGTDIRKIAKYDGVVFYGGYGVGGINSSDRSERDPWRDYRKRMNNWLIHHMDHFPFHKLCYNSSITSKQINDYLDEHGNNSSRFIDIFHQMTPLHMITMNPHAPAHAISALLESNIGGGFCLDFYDKTPLDYARDYNVDGLIGMISSLCMHRYMHARC